MAETIATSQVETRLVELSQKGVLIPKPSEVRDYLSRYADMVDAVLHVCGMALERFGARAHLSLEVYRDPEIDDEYLALYVRQEPYDEDILSAIEELRLEHGELVAGKPGWLLLTTDFRPPR